MYRTSSQRVPSQARNGDGVVPCLAENDGAGRVYAPIDPFKASLALGIRNVFGRTKDRTIDEVPVQRLASTLPQSYSRPPVRHVQHDDPIYDQYHETDAPPQHHELAGDPPYSYPTVVPRSAFVSTPWQNGDEDETMTTAFVPQGLLAAGIRDREERRARDREAIEHTGNSLSYPTPSHKPPPPQMGLLGAITAHDRERVGVASLTERERERKVVGETHRSRSNGPPGHQRGLLGAVTAHEREGAGLGLPLAERERVQETWNSGERQQLPLASSRSGPPQQTGLLLAILAHEEDRESARSPLIERERERRMAEERQRRFDELQAEAYPDLAVSPPTHALGQIPPMERRLSSKVRHTESTMPPSPDGDDSEPTEEGLLGKNPMRPKRNWKELEDRYQGPEAVLMEMLPPFKAPVDEASKNETAMEDVQETNKPTGRATKTGRRLVARVGDSFHPKPKPDLGSPSAAEYPPIPECMEGPVRHPDVKLTWFTITSSLVLDVVPRQIYLHLLLRFPALYFSRVTRIFQDANLGVGEIKRMALEAVDLDKDEGLHRMLVYQGVFPQEWHGGEGKASASYTNLRNSWQGFIDSLMREWKTLNIVSVLLLSAILTILQIDSAASNPLTLFSALLSLVCAFMSLIYGCLFIIRFGTMRKTHKAAEWANESERTSTSIFWNVWVMLAMPAVWLGWSMIFYIVCFMSFVWQTGTTAHPRDYLPTDLEILIPRILISCILALGMVYLILIGATFRRYSDPMEQAWQERIQGWLAEKAHTPAGYEGYYQDISGHKQQNHTSNQEAKVVTKERSAPGMYYPPQKEASSPPCAPAPANPSSARNFSPPASHAEKPRSITKIRRPLPTPPGPRRSQEASHAFVGARSLAKLEGKEARESLSRAATLSFNPFVSFPQTAPTIEKAPTATLSSSTKRLEVEGDVYPGLSHPRLCGGPRPLMQIHGMEPAHSETAGMREEVLPPRRAMAEAPQKDARAVPANASGLEGMEELLVFDWGTHSVHAPLEARVASTSSITTGSLPPATNRVPKGWLEVGLTADAWEGFCTEMACSWVNVVNGRPGALAEMLAFIDRRNGSLQTFGLAMVFVQSKAGADAWPDRSDARNYTLYWRTRKGAHEP